MVILDAQDFVGEPIATIRLPVRGPHGFPGAGAMHIEGIAIEKGLVESARQSVVSLVPAAVRGTPEVSASVRNDNAFSERAVGDLAASSCVMVTDTRSVRQPLQQR